MSGPGRGPSHLFVLGAPSASTCAAHASALVHPPGGYPASSICSGRSPVPPLALQAAVDGSVEQ